LSSKKKFVTACVALGLLALLSWVTLSNDPVVMHDRSSGVDVVIRFRTAVLSVLGLFGALISVAFWRTTIEEKRDSAPQRQ